MTSIPLNFDLAKFRNSLHRTSSHVTNSCASLRVKKKHSIEERSAAASVHDSHKVAIVRCVSRGECGRCASVGKRDRLVKPVRCRQSVCVCFWHAKQYVI